MEAGSIRRHWLSWREREGVCYGLGRKGKGSQVDDTIPMCRKGPGVISAQLRRAK